MEGLRPRIGIDMRLRIKHYESRKENIEQRQEQDGKKYIPFLFQDIQKDRNLVGISKDLEKPDYLQQARKPQQLKFRTYQIESR